MSTADLTEYVSVAGALVAIASFVAISRADTTPRSGTWWLPAVPLALFTAWSLYAVVDAPTGLWSEHVGTPWETQIWLDLLAMAGVALTLAQPRLRALGAPRLPWAVFVIATGSIGALSLLLWLRHAERTATPSPVA